MDDLVTSLIAAVGFAILAVIAAVVPYALRPRRATTPFLDMLRRRGLSVAQAEEAAGFRDVARAAERCASCEVSTACRRALRWRWMSAPACPNAAFFDRATGRKGA